MVEIEELILKGKQSAQDELFFAKDSLFWITALSGGRAQIAHFKK